MKILFVFYLSTSHACCTSSIDHNNAVVLHYLLHVA